MKMLLEWRPLPLVFYMIGSVMFLLGSAISFWREIKS